MLDVVQAPQYVYPSSLYAMRRAIVIDIQNYFATELRKQQEGKDPLLLSEFVNRVSLKSGLSKKKVYDLVEQVLGKRLPVEVRL